MRKNFLFIATILWVAGGTILTYACNVPVFRYALERWQSDVFEMAVGYQSDISQETLELLNELNNNAHGDTRGYNFQLNLYDLSDEEALNKSGFTNEQLEMDPPYVVFRYPPKRMIQEPLAQGPFTREFVQSVLHSPLRQTIAERLIDGQTAVWVYLESGKPEIDRMAYTRLQDEVKRLHSVLQLPDLEDNTDADTIELTGPSDDVRIEFSILRVSYDNPQEKYLIDQLINAERDLFAYEGQPMAFPIYGRGRVLYALIGDGIMRETIQRAGKFLVGPCTCQIKDDNPGEDLLMAVDWQNSLENFLVRDKQPPAPFASFNDLMRPEESTAGESKTSTPTQEESSSSFWQMVFLAIGVIVVIDALVIVVWLKRRGES